MASIIKRALSILTKHEKHLLVPLVLMMIVGALLESMSVTLVIPLIAGIMDPSQLTSGTIGEVLQQLFGAHDGKTYLAILFGVMIAVFLVKNGFLVALTYAQYKTTAQIRRRIQNRLFHYHLSRPYSFFLDPDSGNILRTVSTDSDQFYALLNNIIGFITSLVIAGIMSLVVFVIQPQITLLLLVVLLAEYVVILHFIRPFLRKQGISYRAANGRGNSIVIEAVRGIKSVKISGKEPFFESRYAESVEKLVHARMTEQAFSGAPPRLVEGITVSALLAYLVFLLLSGYDMAGLVPILSAFVLAAARILPAVGSISNCVSNANYYEGSLIHVEEIDETLKREEAEAASAGAHSPGAPETFEREIRLDGIHYTYPTGDTPIFENADMVIPHNRSVGIVGSSGAGKTTVVDILLGLLEPQSGRIYLDDVPVDPSSAAWREKFAYIPQNVFMLNGSIRDNVVFGQADSDKRPVDDSRIWEALEAAQLSEFVRSLKDGLETQIGEAGVRLSGGQVQRLGIARALFSNAPILVFDEATSALDYDTEEALMEAISRLHGSKTLIIIAHRLATIENCDLIYRVEAGKVQLESQRPSDTPLPESRASRWV